MTHVTCNIQSESFIPTLDCQQVCKTSMQLFCQHFWRLRHAFIESKIVDTLFVLRERERERERARESAKCFVCLLILAVKMFFLNPTCIKYGWRKVIVLLHLELPRPNKLSISYYRYTYKHWPIVRSQFTSQESYVR